MEDVPVLSVPGGGHEPQHYHLYKRRWIMLAVFSVCTLFTGAIQFTPTAIQDQIVKYYGFVCPNDASRAALESKSHRPSPNRVDNTRVDLMALIINLAYVPFSFIVAFSAEAKGLSFTMKIGAILFIISTWLRYLSSVFTSDRLVEFWIFFGGQCLLGVVLPFLGLNVVTLFSVNWFGEKERTLAGTVAVLANIIGPSLAFGIAPAVVHRGSDIPTFFLAQAGFCTAACFAVLFIFTERPPSPPSSAAEDDVAMTAASGSSLSQFFGDLKECFTEKWFVVLLVGYGLGYGSLQSFITLINQISIPEGYTSDQAGLFGVAIVLSSIFGALIVGAILDKTRKYVFVIRIVGVIAGGSFVALTFLLRPDRFGWIIGICCVLGASAVAIVPACLEASVEVTFPVAEGTPTGLLNLTGTAVSVAVISIMNKLQDVDPPYKMENALYFNLAIFAVAFAFLFAFNGPYKRLEHERLKNYQLVSN